MKFRFFLVSIFFLQKSFLFCQNWYSGIDGGFSFGLASQNITTNTNIGSIQTSNTIVKGSFGKGININAYIGYKLKNQLSYEIGVSYLKGSDFRGSYSKDTVFKQDLVISGNMLRLTPALKITFSEEKNKIKGYFKLGVIAKLAGQINAETTYLDMQSHSTIVSEIKYSKGLSLGAMAGAGFCYPLSDRTMVFGELYFIAQSWAPKNGDVVKYSINGIDQSDVLNSSQKHIHFTNSYTSSTTAQSTYSPNQQLKQYHNFSSTGLKIGIQFTLGKGK